MKLAWATDIHFDHCDKESIEAFINEAKNEHGDIMILAGDITSNGLAPKVVEKLQERLSIPVYFVLGNHDFYGKSVKEVRFHMPSHLQYLSHIDVISLSKDSALIGHDGWADGQAGDYLRSDILLNDYVYIDELKGLSKKDRLAVLQKLSKESIDNLSTKLDDALKIYTNIILVTHVPPFHQAALYEGKPSNEHWAPHFVNQGLGKHLRRTMEDHPKQFLTVLCGHTHHESIYQPIPNLTVYVGNAQYGQPHLQKSILIDTTS